MQHGRIQAGISSWWGPGATGNQATQRFPLLLDAARGTSFRWAVYYEPEGYSDPSAAQIESDLRYIVSNYAGSPNYLHVGGRPVVLVYSGVGDGCGMADRWKAANTVGAHVVLSTSSGWTMRPRCSPGRRSEAPTRPGYASRPAT